MNPAAVMLLLRWLLVVPAMLAGWYLALITGLLLHALAESFCPPMKVVSGVCTAAWFRSVEEILILLTAALAATLVVLLPTLACPGRKRAVAGITFVVGAVTAIAIGYGASSLWIPVATALFTGLLTLRRVRRRYR